jgi:hypothetical protein
MRGLAGPSQATKLALRTIEVHVAALNTEITALDTQLGELVTVAAPRTLASSEWAPSTRRNGSSPQAATPNGCDHGLIMVRTDVAGLAPRAIDMPRASAMR